MWNGLHGTVLNRLMLNGNVTRLGAGGLVLVSETRSDLLEIFILVVRLLCSPAVVWLPWESFWLIWNRLKISRLIVRLLYNQPIAWL